MKCVFLMSFLFLKGGVYCGPKVHQSQEGGFEPVNRYYESNLPDFHSKHYNFSSKPERKEAAESRFGMIPISTSSYGSSSNGIQNGGYGNIGFALKPMNIDIGGVALGAILGIGLVLIVPKIAGLLHGGYGGYRSLDGEASMFNDILAKIDNSLEQQNIDSTACIQRTVCSYVNSAQKNMRNGEASGIDEFVSALTNNTLVTYMLDFTTLKQAAEVGRDGDIDKCSNTFSKCPLTKDSLLKTLGNLLPA